MNSPNFARPSRLAQARHSLSAGLLVACLGAVLAGLSGPVQAQGQGPGPGPGLAQGLAGAAAGAAVAAAPVAAAPASAPTLTLLPLHWLAGCWHSELDEPGSGEQWMAAAGGTMLGMSRTLKGGRAAQFEFMQIRESALGVVLIAQPSGQAGTRFAAVEISASAAVFERRSADFPQRVVYRLQSDGRLAARIEGLRNGELRSVDFPLRRGPCDAPVSPVGR